MANEGPEQTDAAARQMASTKKMLGYVNRIHSTNLTVVRRYQGGYQGGAYLVRDADGAERVFKWSNKKHWAEQVLRAAPLVAEATSRGYPTPKWHFVGVSPSGYPYHLQDVGEGAPARGPMTAEMVRSALRVIELQTDMKPETETNWFVLDHTEVFEDAAKLTEPLRLCSETVAVAVSRLESWVAPFRDMAMISSDFVHGDFYDSNMLWTDGKVSSLVDIEAAGRGSRFHDVARLAVFCAVDSCDDEVLGVIRDHAKQHARPGEWEVSLTAQLYERMHWDCIRSRAKQSRLPNALDVLLKDSER